MPTVRGVDGIGIEDEVGKGVCEGGEAERLRKVSWVMCGRTLSARTCKTADAPREGASRRWSGCRRRSCWAVLPAMVGEMPLKYIQLK